MKPLKDPVDCYMEGDELEPQAVRDDNRKAAAERLAAYLKEHPEKIRVVPLAQ